MHVCAKSAATGNPNSLVLTALSSEPIIDLSILELVHLGF
jgi:hypothetical protein